MMINKCNSYCHTTCNENGHEEVYFEFNRSKLQRLLHKYTPLDFPERIAFVKIGRVWCERHTYKPASHGALLNVYEAIRRCNRLNAWEDVSKYKPVEEPFQ